MMKSLDEKIAYYKANPKLGDPQWEREWADLLVLKHSKARLPTEAELARALNYAEGEFHLRGHVSAEQWAEGLAFGRGTPEPEDKRRVRHMIGQLSDAQWLRIAERANHLAQREGEAPRYQRDRARRSASRDPKRFRSSLNARGQFHKKRSGTSSFMQRHAQVYASPSIKRSPDYKRAVRMEKSLHQRYPGAVFGAAPLPSAGRREAERVMKAFERAHFYDWADNYRRALKYKTSHARPSQARDSGRDPKRPRKYKPKSDSKSAARIGNRNSYLVLYKQPIKAKP